ncbi:bifunctional adenosylcobinamide kinase/adenosylcobinamide-phosphate guanylyltransferase [Alicyclobacillus acidiphilus]|uniref:bifunctional adenosylcobinamide kinase/adenosylcobinamide-phosphate guanylyltransferase n=1 Tax=Alicyclobacillus acidiphilus TaxID=182455 RepID=UPI00083407FF|nr:bifunctional adenosylcobinamide kinase/adenosylcobinamide-phosphate guanylyltransferase [Alicyclobacillus acidiphilus]
MTVIFVTGGARSGKSRFAERLAAELGQASTKPVCFVATGKAIDAEMAARIEKHQATRPTEWRTIEAPIDVASVIDGGAADVYVIDCLSFLLNNWIYELRLTEDAFFDHVGRLASSLARSDATCIVVSNEVGLGIVPADAESRRFRDWLGWLNQAVARMASQVYLVTSGIAIDLKAYPGAVFDHGDPSN